METVIIRAGRREDVVAAFELVKELAAYERAPNEVTTSAERMAEDGFGTTPLYGMFVAEKAGVIVGISVFYYRYSTWKGKRLYLEDIVVKEAERGAGIGKKLFDRTMVKALEENCSGMMWQVLDWNEPGINFYKKYGSKFDGEWVNVTLESSQLKELLSDPRLNT